MARKQDGAQWETCARQDAEGGARQRRTHKLEHRNFSFESWKFLLRCVSSPAVISLIHCVQAGLEVETGTGLKDISLNRRYRFDLDSTALQPTSILVNL